MPSRWLTGELDMSEAATTIRVTVELFGTPRLRSGRQKLELSVSSVSTRKQLVTALAEACPQLVGDGLRSDLSDLDDGYIFNRNGLAFLGRGDFTVEDGDCLLLISSQAGG